MSKLKSCIVVILLVSVLVAGCSVGKTNTLALDDDTHKDVTDYDTGNDGFSDDDFSVSDDDTYDSGYEDDALVSDDDSDIEFDRDRLLPIGSVVLLKGGNKKIMICGRGQSMVGDDSERLFDYCACYYPEGYLSADQLFLFNHDAIEKVYYIGYEDDDELRFREIVERKIKEYRGE